MGPPEAAVAPSEAGVSPRPGEPVDDSLEPPDLDALAPDLEEPALPDEPRQRAVQEARAATSPLEAAPGSVLDVRFGAAPTDRVVAAMEALREIFRAHRGVTPVVLHVPQGPGRALPMELRSGVAYDAELLAEIRRRLGDGLVELRLGSSTAGGQAARA